MGIGEIGNRYLPCTFPGVLFFLLIYFSYAFGQFPEQKLPVLISTDPKNELKEETSWQK